MCAVVTVVLGVGVIPGRPARAQVRVEIAVPTIQFEVAPPLVVVSPGVQVVPEYEEEVSSLMVGTGTAAARTGIARATTVVGG